MFYFRIKYFLSETDDWSGQLDVHFCYYNNDISLTPNFSGAIKQKSQQISVWIKEKEKEAFYQLCWLASFMFFTKKKMTSLRSCQIQSELMLFEVKVALELSPEGLRSLIFFR